MPKFQFDILNWICDKKNIELRGIENNDNDISVRDIPLQYLPNYCSLNEN